jgi:hypothetical protein
VDKTELAYAAGIVDGEGCISFHTGETYSIMVVVVNTSEWLVQWLQTSFGGAVYHRHGECESRGWKPIHHWTIASEEALGFLKLVYPYLRLKKPQAEIAIKFLEMRGSKGRRLTTTEKVIGETQRIMMGKLNKRGKDK